MISLIIRKNFNEYLGQTVWTIERADGDVLMPAMGVQGFNYSSQEQAEEFLPKIQKHVDSGGGQF